MISGSFIDGILMLYLGFALFVGLRRGLLTIFVDIFGIYGACLIAWLCHEKGVDLVNTLGIDNIHPTLVFLLIWVVVYVLIYIIGKIVSGLFKLTQVNLILRVSGGVLNVIKAGLLITVVLSTLTAVELEIYEKTEMVNFFESIGSKLMNVYNNTLDEDVIDLVTPDKNPLKGDSIIDDNFRYNLLER